VILKKARPVRITVGIIHYPTPDEMKSRTTKSRASILRRHMGAPVEITHPGTGRKMLGTGEDAAALALIAKALGGDVPAIRLILDCVYGKPFRRV
jgi:hypothetical protein